MNCKPFHTVLICLFICSVSAGFANAPFFDSTFLQNNNIVDIQSLDSTLMVDLVYASSDNFTGKNMYGNLTKCYLRRTAAEMLVQAHKYLKERKADYRLLIYDGLRPRRIQEYMWNLVKNTSQQSYVANPVSGSIHNYGAAVDLTITDEEGKPLDMGTPFDYFDVKAQPRYEKYFSDSGLISGANLSPTVKTRIRADINKNGLLSDTMLKNRRLLREVMEKAGFISIPNEWWHFNAFQRSVIRKKFTVVE